MNPAALVQMQLRAELLAGAQAAGAALLSVQASKMFELATAVSWAVDRFGDDETSASRRVEVATAGPSPDVRTMHGGSVVTRS
jgi:hypothetical protein